MDFALALSKTLRSLRRNGLAKTARLAFRAVFPLPVCPDEFDRKYGTDTATAIPLWELKIDSDNSVYGGSYQTSSEEHIYAAIGKLGILDWRRFKFVDLGCGKGRPLIVASRFGFCELIGVEFSAKLAEIARTNVDKLGITNASIVQMDAARFAFPGGNMVIYLCNPFSDEVMYPVVEHLSEAIVRVPGEVFVVYDLPRCPDALNACGLLSLIVNDPMANQCVWHSRGPN